MKKNKIDAPIEVMMTITNNGDSDKVIKYLQSQNVPYSIVMMGKGTNPSPIADIFTFGIDDRDILVTFIPTDKEKQIVQDLTKVLGLEDKNLGLIMILPINSASSNLLEKYNVEIGG